jgi:hypothetical protein
MWKEAVYPNMRSVTEIAWRVCAKLQENSMRLAYICASILTQYLEYTIL